jgi:hypothetical protein
LYIYRRLGAQQGSTRYILQHEFFDGVDLKMLSRCELKAPYIPPIKDEYDLDMDDIPTIRPYHGDQTIFKTF